MTTTMPLHSTTSAEERLRRMCDMIGGCDCWPSATSFPDLDDASELPAPTPDLAGLADVMGARDPWCSGTSFPDLG